MYRQFLVREEDTHFQRILWRDSPNEPLKKYESTRLTFGEASAPNLSTRCLKKLAEDEGHNFPAAKIALLKDFYIDDLVTGANSIESAIEIREQ